MHLVTDISGFICPQGSRIHCVYNGLCKESVKSSVKKI